MDRPKGARFARRYGSALLALAAATLVRWLLDPLLGNREPYPTYFVAILWIAWHGGLGPTLFASVCGALVADYFFVYPRGQFFFQGGGETLEFCLYVVAGVAVAVLGESLRHSRGLIEKSEERFRLLVSAVRDYAIYMVDPMGRVVSWNAGAQRIKGYQADEVVGQHFSRFYTPEDVEAGKPARDLACAREQGRFEEEGWRVRNDGSRFWANALITAITDDAGQLRGFAKVTRDLTERMRAEQALRALAGRLLTAQESERSRLAREMHDDLTQRLAILAIDAGRLEQHPAAAGALAAALADLKAQLIHLSVDVHDLSRRLHPAILDDLGLAEALRSECNSYAQREGIAVHYTAPAERAPLPKNVAVCLYRVAQEGLRNIAKHAATREAYLSLQTTDSGVLLSIEDHGSGFQIAQAKTQPGLGMASMEERVRLIGGDFAVRSEPGKGTLIEVWAPLGEEIP